VKPQCPIVALGASAGGLEVFGKFFDRMPCDTGLAFLLLQHLDRGHDTLMPGLLSKHTTMPLVRTEDGLKIQPNHIYVVASNGSLTMENCTLRVEPLSVPSDGRMIDSFFRSAAQDQKDNFIGIILSGTGTDGTLGLKAIKEHGGLSIVQKPETAKFDAMPRNAALSGFADFILPIEEIPAQVLNYIAHATAIAQRKGVEVLLRQIAAHLPAITRALRERTGHDFSRYKQSTLIRRVQRRMQVLYVDSPEKYLDCLNQDMAEIDSLFRDLLIGVTKFFRDPETFEMLANSAIPNLFKGKAGDGQVRVWVPGCASGEEAYSIAILLAEHAQKLKQAPKIQLFATDLDVEALEVARKGKYPAEEVAEHVSPDRLHRFFHKKGESFELIDSVRELCVFSPHSLIKDPPFSRLDLISCRNVLIYLEVDLQRKLLPLFHYALNPSGFLLLGLSENIASRSELFRSFDAKHRLFQRKPAVLHTAATLPLIDTGRVTKLQTLPALAVSPAPREANVAHSIERIIIEEYAPASVVINEQGDVVYFAGDTGKFLKPPPGRPNNKLIAMARDNLRLELRTIVHRSLTTGKEAVRKNLQVKIGSVVLQMDLIVRPLPELGADSGLFIVLFRELLPSQDANKSAHEDFTSHEHPVIKQLEGELKTNRETLQTTIEELETSNEELKSANEELVSTNEELQSANEELQTSKEEVQSANDELQRKIEEADQAYAELRQAHQDRARYVAIVESSEDAIIGESLDGVITNWNHAAERIFGYSPAEIIGQSILSITPPELHEEEGRILQRLRRGERVEHYETTRLTQSGRIIQISVTSSPIRDPQGFVTGVSKIARDITAQTAAARANLLLASIVDSSVDAIISKTLEGKITSWNRAAEKLFGYSSQEMIGQPITRIFPEDRLNEEPNIIARISNGQRIEHFETVRKTKEGKLIDISLSLSPIRDLNGKIIGASKIARDITSQKAAMRTAQLLAAVVDSSDDAIISKRLDGTVTSWNKAAENLFGYTAEEMIGRPITRLFPEDRLEEEPGIIARIARGERVEHFETVRKTKHGGLLDLSLTISPIMDAQGRVVGASKIARDITERKRLLQIARQEIEQRKLTETALQKAKDELERRVNERTASLLETTDQLETFCYSVSHDLRSPLRAQQSFAQILLEDYKDDLDGRALSFVTRILNSAERLDQLVQDLLTFSRLSRVELQFQNVNLAKVVQEVLIANGEDFQRRKALITVGRLHSVFAYEPTLHLVVTNLLTNAVKFTKPGGKAPCVKIWSEQQDGRVRVWVEDNGIGIDPKAFTKIFGIFQRLHPGDEYPGTGIGLAIVQKGIERMGGTVGVESHPGKGSRFWIELAVAIPSALT
jgi:two-component system, chemotaxis family, CheB/CheR fusion protein